jgi:allantoicase
MSAAPSNVAAFQGLVDLVSSNLGGKALLSSDDFFAGMDNLTNPAPAAFDPAAYTDRGKLMDGWESRRKRVPGHDWCILRLGVRGRLRGVDIDTSFFMGNHPPFASIDAISAPDATLEDLTDRLEWTEVLPQTALQRGSHNLAAIASDAVYTHIRLRIFPDGGVARLRAYGDPAPHREASGALDLAALANGGRAVACSDMFF